MKAHSHGAQRLAAAVSSYSCSGFRYALAAFKMSSASSSVNPLPRILTPLASLTFTPSAGLNGGFALSMAHRKHARSAARSLSRDHAFPRQAAIRHPLEDHFKQGVPVEIRRGLRDFCFGEDQWGNAKSCLVDE
ncbi:MAG: hypothetical protein P0Y66_07555 [Candidatus Kaistia colombiensis]|nr:MAG: hypothetical protein P0Y66_07555 [Kaistia sp.]